MSGGFSHRGKRRTTMEQKGKNSTDNDFFPQIEIIQANFLLISFLHNLSGCETSVDDGKLLLLTRKEGEKKSWKIVDIKLSTRHLSTWSESWYYFFRSFSHVFLRSPIVKFVISLVHGREQLSTHRIHLTQQTMMNNQLTQIISPQNPIILNGLRTELYACVSRLILCVGFTLSSVLCSRARSERKMWKCEIVRCVSEKAMMMIFETEIFLCVKFNAVFPSINNNKQPGERRREKNEQA